MGLPYLGGGQQTLTFTGTGSDETNYVVPLKLHKGARAGDATGEDVHLDDLCETDFSDVFFTDTSGNTLDHYLHSHGNYELTPDETHLGSTSIILPSGKIVASGVTGVTTGVAESSDNGQTWAVLFGSAAAQILHVSPSTGYYFLYSGNTVKRSTDANHTTWTTVLDMTAVEGDGRVLPYGFCEAENGVLFMGRYQDVYAAVLYRSLDDGATWEVIRDTTVSDPTEQHYHGVAVDPYTNYLYAGVDGNRHLIRSTNATDPEVAAGDIVFTTIANTDFVQALFGDGWRMFSIENPLLDGSTIINTVVRTTDDVNFTSEILTGLCGRVLREAGGNIYLTTSAQYNQRYPQVLKRAAGGSWETIWAAKFDETSQNLGPRIAFSEGTPTGGESQLLIGHEGSAGYKNLRLYGGGSHYQALAYVKIPSLPAAGGTIRMGWNGTGISTLDAFPDIVQAGLLARWKLDEGSGTTIADTTENNKDAVLTPGTGSWNAAGLKRAGSNIPDIVLPGKSYHFNGDGRIAVTGSDTDGDFQFVNGFSILLWFKSTNVANQWLLGKGLAGGNNWSIRIQTGSGFLKFFYSQTDYSQPAPYIPASDGAAHFVGISINASDELTWVVDGKDYAPVTLAQTIIANAGLLTIGADASGALPFTGDIDDVQIYNAALTALQMRQIYESRTIAATEPELT